jgi:hypothetical protein
MHILAPVLARLHREHLETKIALARSSVVRMASATTRSAASNPLRSRSRR